MSLALHVQFAKDASAFGVSVFCINFSLQISGNALPVCD